ncbi:MAG: hypothetical protein BWY59_02021 [Verrucomicrobia bacterium ADurb.Bin345]|nr:MAG: hypothetical protein BWY59_02021 [Verrucomicrobia bacterium ADurb.Bin345]
MKKLLFRIAVLTAAIGLAAAYFSPCRADTPVDKEVEEGEVVTVFVDEGGDIYWDGERIDTNTLATRLSLLDGEDAVALYSSVDESSVRQADRNIMESVLRVGVPLVLVEDENRVKLPLQAGDGQARPVTLSTARIRQALDLYDKAVGREDRHKPLSGTDVLLRFDPNDEQGYLLRRIEVGLGGRSLWIVHETLGEQESSTSIRLKKEW